MIDIDDLPGEAADIEKSDVQPPESEKHPDIEEQIRRMFKSFLFYNWTTLPRRNSQFEEK